MTTSNIWIDFNQWSVTFVHQTASLEETLYEIPYESITGCSISNRNNIFSLFLSLKTSSAAFHFDSQCKSALIEKLRKHSIEVFVERDKMSKLSCEIVLTSHSEKLRREKKRPNDFLKLEVIFEKKQSDFTENVNNLERIFSKKLINFKEHIERDIYVSR